MIRPPKLGLAFVSIMLTGIAAAQPPATYKLTVGQVLVYHLVGHSVQHGKPGGLDLTEVYRVIGQTPDGNGWRISIEGGDTFRLWPDGRTTDDNGSPRLPTPQFPMLPPAADAADWKTDTIEGVTTDYHAVPSTQPGEESCLGYVESPDSTMDRLLQMKSSWTGSFDPDRGLLDRTVYRFEYGSGKQGGSGRTDCRLESNTVMSIDAVKDYARQLDALTTARKAYYSSLYSEATGETKNTDRIGALKSVRSSLTDPKFVSAIDSLIKQDPIVYQQTRQSIEDRNKLIGQPAPDFDLVDLDGQRHSLHDLRGKVVVLDFWYLDCPYCLKAMPQVKQLSIDNQGKPVQFFGMNIDSDKADAVRAVDAFGLSYPQLRAAMKNQAADHRDVARAYGVNGYPTLILIDADGIIRDVHFGYSKSLHDDMEKKIATLLPAK